MSDTTPADLDLDALEAVVAKMTPGPWKACEATMPGGCQCGLVWSIPLEAVVVSPEHGMDGGSVTDAKSVGANALAIAALRNAAPALLAEVRRLRAVEAAAKAGERYCAQCGEWGRCACAAISPPPSGEEARSSCIIHGDVWCTCRSKPWEPAERVPTAAEGVAAVARLGIDVAEWAEETRAKVAAARTYTQPEVDALIAAVVERAADMCEEHGYIDRETPAWMPGMGSVERESPTAQAIRALVMAFECTQKPHTIFVSSGAWCPTCKRTADVAHQHAICGRCGLAVELTVWHSCAPDLTRIGGYR